MSTENISSLHFCALSEHATSVLQQKHSTNGCSEMCSLNVQVFICLLLFLKGVEPCRVPEVAIIFNMQQGVLSQMPIKALSHLSIFMLFMRTMRELF